MWGMGYRSLPNSPTTPQPQQTTTTQLTICQLVSQDLHGMAQLPPACMKLSEIVCDTSFDLTSKPGEILNQIVKVLREKQLTVPKCDDKILKSVSAYLGKKFKKHQVSKVKFVDLENTYLQAKMIPTEELLENQVI